MLWYCCFFFSQGKVKNISTSVHAVLNTEEAWQYAEENGKYWIYTGVQLSQDPYLAYPVFWGTHFDRKEYKIFCC